MKIKSALALAICLLIPLSIGGLSGLATASSINAWYVQLAKPSFSPPNWIFGPVWTTLYIIMGISTFLIWKSEAGKYRTQAFLIYWIQLTLNFSWSFLFFYFHWIGIALVEICLIWLAILFMILSFRKVNSTAAWLNLPYLGWVSFATILNFALWRLN